MTALRTLDLMSADASDLRRAVGAGPMALRQCATRCNIPDSNSASNKQASGWSTHIATSDLTSLQVIFPNWYMSGSNAETGGGGDATITASVEYPRGTFTQITFGGSASGSIANAAQLLSDAVSVSIPRQAKFRIRYYLSAPSGIVFDNRLAPEDVMRFGASGLPDVTMGGTPSGGTNATTQSYRPCAILSYTTRLALFLPGDSRTAGQWGVANGDTQTDTFGGLGILERSFCRGEAPYIVAQRAGDSFASFNAGSTLRRALAAYCDVIVSGYGISDVQVGGATASSVVALFQTFSALFGNKPVYQTTLLPLSTSTDGWATTANQTTSTTNGVRIGFNNALRTGALSGTYLTGLAGFVELADEIESARDSGIWKAPGYTGDGVHGLAVANEVIRKSAALEFLRRLS